MKTLRFCYYVRKVVIDVITKGSDMSAHVLLNSLNELMKRDKCEACRALYFFFTTSLINSILQEHEC